jgi:hypothetical protein
MNGGRASKVAQDVYRAVSQRRSKIPPATGNRPLGLRDAEELVRGSLTKIHAMGF